MRDDKRLQELKKLNELVAMAYTPLKPAVKGYWAILRRRPRHGGKS